MDQGHFLFCPRRESTLRQGRYRAGASSPRGENPIEGARLKAICREDRDDITIHDSVWTSTT